MIWLIAEDDVDILNLMVTISQVWGHTTMSFSNGQKAWDWLDKVEAGKHEGKMPEFALMDIRMPGKFGNEVANRMRTITPLKHIPIALMTAYALTPNERDKLIQNDGVDQIINKPLPTFEDLRDVINSIIQKKQSSNQQV